MWLSRQEPDIKFEPAHTVRPWHAAALTFVSETEKKITAHIDDVNARIAERKLLAIRPDIERDIGANVLRNAVKEMVDPLIAAGHFWQLAEFRKAFGLTPAYQKALDQVLRNVDVSLSSHHHRTHTLALVAVRPGAGTQLWGFCGNQVFSRAHPVEAMNRIYRQDELTPDERDIGIHELIYLARTLNDNNLIAALPQARTNYQAAHATRSPIVRRAASSIYRFFAGGG